MNKCSVPGCRKGWDMRTAIVDTEFIKQMEEYDRTKAASTEIQQYTQIIDQDYTQV